MFSLHRLAMRNSSYAGWHTLPYATMLHFLVLTIFLSFVALKLENKLLDKMDAENAVTMSYAE